MGNHGEKEPVAETAESSPLNKLADTEVTTPSSIHCDLHQSPYHVRLDK